MSRQRIFALAVALALVVKSIPVSAAATIPFAQALDDASISVERLDDIVEYALLVGNGDINALVYTDSGNVEIVLTKNDVWDARLDTTLDPPLPTLKRIKELGRGTWPDRGQVLPEGVTWEGPDSYHANPYPCPRACARLILGTRRKQGRWRGIRAQGRHNEWESREDASVMSIEGNPGVSNGWRCESVAFSTDDYDLMKLTLSGSTNARYYVDVMDLWGHVIFATKWQQAPGATATRLFPLPAGKQVDSVILYTQTSDGKHAENRFKTLQFDGRKGTLPVKLNLATLPTTRARLDLRRAVAQIDGASGGPPRAAIRALAQRNAFLVEADVAARLEQFHTADTPDAQSGQTEGIRWLVTWTGLAWSLPSPWPMSVSVRP